MKISYFRAHFQTYLFNTALVCVQLMFVEFISLESMCVLCSSFLFIATSSLPPSTLHLLPLSPHLCPLLSVCSASPLSLLIQPSINPAPPLPPPLLPQFFPMPILCLVSPLSSVPLPYSSLLLILLFSPTSAGLRLSLLTSLCHMPSLLFSVPQRP